MNVVLLIFFSLLSTVSAKQVKAANIIMVIMRLRCLIAPLFFVYDWRSESLIRLMGGGTDTVNMHFMKGVGLSSIFKKFIFLFFIFYFFFFFYFRS